MLVALHLLSLLVAPPWECPRRVCGEAPEPVVDRSRPVYARELRAVMRSFGRLDGQRPWFTTSNGDFLRASMSVARIETVLRGDHEIPEVTAHYGHCATHSQTCAWAVVSVLLTDLEEGCPKPDGVSRRTETASHRVLEFHAFPPESGFEVQIPPQPCGASETASAPADEATPPRAAMVYIGGTLGRGRRALGKLPVRAIQRVLASD